MADTECAGAVKNIEDGGNVGTHEASAALGGSEIIAKLDLQFLDRCAEVRKIVIGERGQSLHQDQPAQAGGVRRAHVGKGRHGGSFFRSMDALTLRIEDHQDAPILRNRQTANDRSETLPIAATAVDDEPAARKEPDADT